MSTVARIMMMRIADFFRYMSDNGEQRLYYVIPINRSAPYAYQHSSIRDVATIVDIFDLVQFFHEHSLALSSDANDLFEKVGGNTVEAYHSLYQRNTFLEMPEGNIGDLGFFLLALQKCDKTYPKQLPIHWEDTKIGLVKQLLDWQRADGSMRIFFDESLHYHEKSSEAFYLPEALIGLIEGIGSFTKELDDDVIHCVQKAVSYCCQERNRENNLSTDSAIFYANWQFQLLYHFFEKNLGDKKDSLEVRHLIKLIEAIKETRFANYNFGTNVATVEVACYFEGLVHAQRILSPHMYDKWFKQEIDRCLHFLYEVQGKHLKTVQGGFVHSYSSHEARIDVAGHVFSGLRLLI